MIVLFQGAERVTLASQGMSQKQLFFSSVQQQKIVHHLFQNLIFDPCLFSGFISVSVVKLKLRALYRKDSFLTLGMKCTILT